MNIEFTPEEYALLEQWYRDACEYITATYPLDPKNIENNRKIARLVIKVLRRKGVHTGMDMKAIEELERIRHADQPYCRAP